MQPAGLSLHLHPGFSGNLVTVNNQVPNALHPNGCQGMFKVQVKRESIITTFHLCQCQNLTMWNIASLIHQHCIGNGQSFFWGSCLSNYLNRYLNEFVVPNQELRFYLLGEVQDEESKISALFEGMQIGKQS